MAKASTSSPSGNGSNGAEALNPKETMARMTAMNGAAGELFAEAVKAYFQGVSAWNEELMTFMKARMDSDMALGGQLTKCDSWQEAAKLQQSWMQQTTEQYLSEAGKLMELASKTATEQWAPIYDRANKAMEELRSS
ncbi:MAG: phasin family protein [Kiloniellales bacterium]|nr:phasin family protein [Kiloniellales bacterium]